MRAPCSGLGLGLPLQWHTMNAQQIAMLRWCIWRPAALFYAVVWLCACVVGLAWRPTQAQTTAPLPHLTLAGVYQPHVALEDYWVSEKYDGVRAWWDGQQLWTRQGHRIHAPVWFTHGWPAQALDGELWAGRGQFSHAQSTISQRKAPEAAWQQLRYMAFDAPQHTGNFVQRQQWLQGAVKTSTSPWLQWAPQWQVASDAELQQQLRTLEAAGAEGLMLRHAAAPYRGGRHADLLKVKSLHDAEAVVVAHIPGRGQFTGLLGALEVQMPSGQRFRIGTGFSRQDRHQPPPVGSTITYRYQGLHDSGLPRFARYWRVRESKAPQQ